MAHSLNIGSIGKINNFAIAYGASSNGGRDTPHTSGENAGSRPGGSDGEEHEEGTGGAEVQLSSSPPSIDGNAPPGSPPNDTSNDTFSTPVQDTGESSNRSGQHQAAEGLLPLPVPVVGSIDYFVNQAGGNDIEADAAQAESETDIDELKPYQHEMIGQGDDDLSDRSDDADSLSSTQNRQSTLKHKEQTESKVPGFQQQRNAPLVQAGVAQWAPPCKRSLPGTVGDEIREANAGSSLATDYGSITESGIGMSELNDYGDQGFASVRQPTSLNETSRASLQLNVSGSQDQDVAVTMPTYLSLPNLNMSLQCDGGGGDNTAVITGQSSRTAEGRGQSSRTDEGTGQALRRERSEDILVVIRGNMLLQDEEEPSVLVTDMQVAEDVLKESQQRGSFPEGTSTLIKLRWFGFRQLKMTKWSFNLNTEIMASQQENLVRAFSATLLDRQAEVVRQVMRLLQSRRPSVYLQSVGWNGREGLVLYLGHANTKECTECMGENHQSEIITILYQLLPDFAHKEFNLQSVALSTEEREAGLTLPGGTFRLSSLDTSDLFSSYPGSSSTPTESGGTTFHDRKYQGSLSDHESYTQVSPSVEVIDTSSQSSIQVVSPQNGHMNMMLSEHQERFQTLTDQLSTQQVSHQREIDSVMQSLQEMRAAFNQREADGRASLQKVTSSLEHQEESLQSLKQEIMSQVSEMAVKLKEQREMLSSMHTGWRTQQELMDAMQQNIQAREVAFQHAEDGMKRWCANFEVRGRRQLEGALKQVQEMDLHRREVTAQRDVQLDAVLRKFKSDVLAHVLGKEQTYERYFQDIHAHIMSQSMRDESKYQASLLEINQVRRSLEELKRGGMPGQLPALGRQSSETGDQPSATGGQSSPTGDQSSVADGHSYGMDGKILGADGSTYTVGVVTADSALPTLGVFGAMRGSFTDVLSKSEALTTKYQGSKEEQMSSNQYESMRIPDPFMTFTGVPGSGKKADGERISQSSASVYVTSPAAMLDGKKAAASKRSNDSAGKASEKTNSAKQKKNASKSPESASTPSAEIRESAHRDSKNGESTPQSAVKTDTETSEDMAQADQFLDWINIRGNLRGQSELTQRITKSVNLALKEEKVPASRSKSMDTIICLDVSDSIVKDGQLEKVKKTALAFVDGIEDLMHEMDLEENLAVVAMGGGARVVQHLTNDLSLVHNAIETLENGGGRSPYMEALLVCLAANKGRGGIVNVSGVYKVRPRIIVITDGRPTDEAVDTGADLQSNISQVKFSLIQLLSELSSKKHKATPKPICWVPIGTDPDKKFMESLANLSGGQLVPDSEITSLCRYYKVQQTIGRVYKMVKNRKNEYGTEAQINGLVTAISVDISENERKFIVDEVRKLQKAPPEDEQPDADDFDNVYEDEEKVKNKVLPPLGTRVRRGPDWRWKNQDTDGPGTVIHHNKDDNWIYVKWDNRVCNAYRYNEDDAMDLKVTENDPRDLPPNKDVLDFGVRVVRGPDWKYENQDAGGPGTVIRVRESDGKVKVRWDATGKVYKYNYNAEKGQEVQKITPEFPRTEKQPPGDNKRDKSQNPPEPEKTIPMWKWRDSKGQWRLYQGDVAAKLESEYQRRPTASHVIFRDGKSRRVSFKLWRDKAVDRGDTCDVMREMVDEEGRNDLLALDLSLQLE